MKNGPNVIEWRKPGSEPVVLIGVKVKPAAKTNVVEALVQYRIFQFDADGKPIKATWSEALHVGGMTRIVDKKNEQPYEQFSRVYTFQKLYKTETGFAPAPRFLKVPQSIADALAMNYPGELEVREVAANNVEAWNSAAPWVVTKETAVKPRLPETPNPLKDKENDRSTRGDKSPLAPDGSPSDKGEPEKVVEVKGGHKVRAENFEDLGEIKGGAIGATKALGADPEEVVGGKKSKGTAEE